MTKNISEQIDALLRFQELDGEIYRLSQQKKAKPAALAESNLRLEGEKIRLASAEKEQKEFELKRKNKEVDLQAKEEAIKKYQVQLYQVKTNKEYASLQSEIGGLKADNSMLEEEILRFMEEVDQKKGEISKVKGIIEQLTKAYQEEEEKVRVEVAALEAEISALQERRQALVPEVDSNLLSRYERILVGREGQGMVLIDDTSCLGCHMQLPPQVINEARLREKIVTCENCSRILYSKEE